MNKYTTRLIILTITTVIIRLGLLPIVEGEVSDLIKLILSVTILGFGAFVVLKKAADIIEETTEVLSERTKLASGLLQSLGTAFPDMALGVVAAMISLQTRETNYQMAINYAVIAAATTFGSNIYNVGHAAWCIFRQNVANFKDQTVLMFPGFKNLGSVKPMNQHKRQLSNQELQNTLDAINVLTILTAFVAITMVLFGKVTNPLILEDGDMYQLIRPVGFVILSFSLYVLYLFRHNHHQPANTDEVETEEKYYAKKSNLVIAVNLAIAGAAILFTAESMIKAIEIFSHLTHIPLVIAGVLSGLVGCLGEMIVVHDFSVNPNGRLGDAIMGVAMDNIVTTFGASIVAVMGGIFLGGRSLIMIFVLILALNTTLLWQVAKMQPFVKKA